MKNNVATAVLGLQKIQRQHKKELDRINRHALHALRPNGKKKSGRVLSAAARAKISKAQRLRWAEWKKHQKTDHPEKTGREGGPKKEPVAAA